MLRNRPLKIFRSVEDGNSIDASLAADGAEDRKQVDLFAASLLEPPGFWSGPFDPGAVLTEEYKTVSGSQLSDDTQLSTRLQL